MGLMERMRDASALEAMSLGEKVFGSMQVALIGVAIVFVVLFILFVAINLMEKVLHKDEKQQSSAPKAEATVEIQEEVVEETVDDTELVAVITAAVAASLHTSTHNIIVRNIERVPDAAPAWNKLGRMQQINRG